MSRSWFAALAAVVVLAGCSSTATQTAAPPSQPAGPKPPPALTAQQALGDLTTIDYCSLLDTATATASAKLTLGTPVSAPDECYLGGKLDGQTVDIEIGHLDSRDADPDRENDPLARDLDRGLKIQTNNAGTTECEHYLTFADGTHLSADVRYDGKAPGDATEDQHTTLCTVDNALLDTLINRVTTGQVAHLTYPAGSVGAADACQILGDVRAAAANPFADKLKLVPAPTGHHCSWYNGVDDSRIDLLFGYGVFKDKPNTTIASRATISYPDDLSCDLATELGASPVRGAAQEAQVSVRVPEDGSYHGPDACTVAKSVAASVWPRLPAA